MTDYLILGGGLAGCVLATRLKEQDPSVSVTLVEGGPDEHLNPLMIEPMGTFQLHMSTFEYNYRTLPQANYDGRQVYNSGGKVLSGSSSVNYAMWTRGGADDYNLWAKLVGDNKWSYEGLLPFFRKSETHHDRKSVDSGQHGFDGPIHTTASARDYPLREQLRSAFFKGTGLPFNEDPNGGNPIGVAPFTENWRDGKRQPAGKAYGLDGVSIITNAWVNRIVLDGKTAKGAELSNGQKIFANREVIVSCGALRTPQVLMLSGIGPAAELSKIGVKQEIDSPEVGLNFHDHIAMSQFYKIKHPEKGLSAGSPEWKDPTYLLGIPADTVITASVPREILQPAMEKDKGQTVSDEDPHLQPSRGHIEILPLYANTESPLTDLNIPFDGTVITSGTLLLLPTSRGSIRLASADPQADPLIDPNYYDTEADRVALRHVMRLSMRSFETPEGQTIIDHEIPPPGYSPLTSKSSDEEIDAHVKRKAATWFHPAGSAAMGKVVDTELKVLGVDRLRVVDASVLPCPIGAHYQVVTYAVAEQAAELITKEWSQLAGK
ncbi:MAG: hypothetical protein Q9166_006930 [cf. Caloplaca sp. 2 TL-2023]